MTLKISSQPHNLMMCVSVVSLQFYFGIWYLRILTHFRQFNDEIRKRTTVKLNLHDIRTRLKLFSFFFLYHFVNDDATSTSRSACEAMKSFENDRKRHEESKRCGNSHFLSRPPQTNIIYAMKKNRPKMSDKCVRILGKKHKLKIN